MQAYTDEQYERLLTEAGFTNVRQGPSMGELEAASANSLQVFSRTQTPQPTR